MVNATALLLAASLLRAFALALTALVLSDVEAGAWGAFLLGWSLVFLVVTGPATLLEAPIRSFLDERMRTEGSRIRRAGLAFALGGMAALALGRLLLVVRVLEPWGPVAFALAGALPVLLRPREKRAAAEGAGASHAGAFAAPPGGRRRPVLAGLILGATAGLLFANPEARYQEKYARNHLGPADLAKAPPLPGRDPESLTDLEVARALAETAMRTHPPEALAWSWEEAVLVEGLLAYARRSGRPEPLDYVRKWVDAHAQEALTTTLYADSAAPALAVLALGEAGRARPEVDQPIIERIDGYIREEAPRTREGVVSHAGLLGLGLAPREAWVDTLFMHGVYLDRRARRGDAPWALEEAERLGLAMARSLQPGGSGGGLPLPGRSLHDEEAGAFRHAAVDLGPLVLRYPAERFFWARGNAWALAFMVDHALARGAPGAVPDPLGLSLRRLRETFLASERTELGLWRTELRPATHVEPMTGSGARSRPNPEETCASALIGWSLRRGAARGLEGFGEPERRAARAAVIGVRARIRWQGGHPTLVGTSIGTHPGFRAYYRAVPSEENVGHGVGAALLLLCEEEAGS